MNYLCIARRLF